MIFALLLLPMLLYNVQGRHFLIETNENDSELTEKELGAILDVLPEEDKELYNKANSADQARYQKKVLSVYGHNLEKMVESAKDGSMEKLFSGTEEGNDYADYQQWCLDLAIKCKKGKPKKSGCYDRSSTVSLANGEVIRMDDLRIGQFVQVTDPAGIEGTSKFIGWTEKHHSLTEFYRLTTESENILTMTGTHGLFIWKAGSVMATFAKDLTVGDLLVVSKNTNSFQAVRLKSISIVHEFGALGPLTESGTIMVNNVSTSCYASYPHQLAHFALLPARWWPKIFLDDDESQTKEGIRNYITNIKWLGRLLSTSGFRIDEQNADSSFSKKVMAPIATASLIGLSVVVFFKKTTI